MIGPVLCSLAPAVNDNTDAGTFLGATLSLLGHNYRDSCIRSLEAMTSSLNYEPISVLSPASSMS